MNKNIGTENLAISWVMHLHQSIDRWLRFHHQPGVRCWAACGKYFECFERAIRTASFGSVKMAKPLIPSCLKNLMVRSANPVHRRACRNRDMVQMNNFVKISAEYAANNSNLLQENGFLPVRWGRRHRCRIKLL